MPGGKLVKLPTVLVDITPSTFTLFSCLSVPLLPPVIELVIASRQKTMHAHELADILALATKLKVPYDSSKVRRVNHTTCSIPGSTRGAPLKALA